MPSVLSDDENGDQNRKDTSKGSVNSACLYKSASVRTNIELTLHSFVIIDFRSRLTSKIGSHLLPRAEIIFVSSVIATKSNHVCHVVADQTGFPSESVKILTHPMLLDC